ncbi:hypothetical protein C804_00513 [Lachnospiraceae bacterium A4]|nr:hypothetical protein C804_00513 [Lachnospiraceae bacterium A4]
MESKDELIDVYGYQTEVYTKSYNMMGRLLDNNFVKREVKRREWSDIYIYGGGYLGIQLYRVISPLVNVLSLVDKKGKLLINNINDIPVMDMSTLRGLYENQPVVITPLRFYREIYHDLKEFVAEDKIIFLEDFGGK